MRRILEALDLIAGLAVLGVVVFILLPVLLLAWVLEHEKA